MHTLQACPTKRRGYPPRYFLQVFIPGGFKSFVLVSADFRGLTGAFFRNCGLESTYRPPAEFSEAWTSKMTRAGERPAQAVASVFHVLLPGWRCDLGYHNLTSAAARSAHFFHLGRIPPLPTLRLRSLRRAQGEPFGKLRASPSRSSGLTAQAG